MGKGFKGKPCVYCVGAEATTADHVIARAFFLPGTAENLPKIPACAKCNNEKSKIEHYLAAVMPFGGRHTSASQTLSTLAPPRLAKNQKLHRALAEAMATMFTSRDGGPWALEMTVPIDGKELERLFGLIARGLAWHHWKIFLDSEHIVLAGFLSGVGTKLFEGFLALGAHKRESGNFGNGVFTYEGIQSAGCPELTVWRMSLYRAQVGGDPRHPMVRCENAYALTAPMKWRVSSMLMEIMGKTVEATDKN